MATDEIRFGDNDRLAALVAHLVRADLLVLLSDVDGLYDGDPGQARHHADRRGARAPRTSPRSRSAARARPVSAPAAWSPRSRLPGSPRRRHPRRTDLAPSRAADALAGRDTGTYFHRTGRRSADRLLWLQHASTPQGALTLDDGAVRAVVERPHLAAAGRDRRRRGRIHRRRPGGAADTERPRDGPRPGELRRQGDPPAARPLHPRAGPRTRSRVRTRGRTQGRSGGPAPEEPSESLSRRTRTGKRRKSSVYRGTFPKTPRAGRRAGQLCPQGVLRGQAPQRVTQEAAGETSASGGAARVDSGSGL